MQREAMTLDEVNAELKQLNQRRHELFEEKRRLLAARPQRVQSETSQFWAPIVLPIIESHPGVSREQILKLSGQNIPEQQLTNCLTTLRRRGSIENRGTRKSPQWFVKAVVCDDRDLYKLS